MPLPAFSSRPPALTSTSVSPSVGSPSMMPPAVAVMLTLAVPAFTNSSVMSPVPACSITLPLLVEICVP